MPEDLPIPRSFELTKELLEAAKELVKTQAEVQRKTSETAKSVTETSAKASKRIAANAATSIDDIITSMDKGIEKAGKRAKKQVEDIGAAVRKEHTNRSKQDTALNFGDIFNPARGASKIAKAGGIGKVTKSFAKDEFMTAVKEIGNLATSIAPQIVTFLSLAASIKLVIERIFDLDKKTVALAMNLGGNYKAALDLQVQTYGEVVDATNLTKESVEEMGLAFYQAGIPLTKNKSQLVEYMTVAGNLNKVFGTSFDQLARYIENLRHAGKTADDVFDAYDAMYQKMHKYQLTLSDFNSSLTEGDDLWGEFGSRSNRTLTQLQSDVLETKGIFKSFNLDVKATGGLLQSMMGDPKTQMRQAALVAAMKGKGQSSAFIDIATGSARGAQDLIESLVTYATKFPGAHYGESESQLAKLGDNGYAAVLAQRSRLEENMAKQFNMSGKMVSQVLADYTAFMETHRGASIDDWTKKRLKDHQDPNRPGGLLNALDTKSNSVESSLTAMSNRVFEIADHIAYLVLEQVPGLLKSVNGFLKMIPGMGSSEVLSFDKWKGKTPLAALPESKSVLPPLFMPPPISASQSPQAYDKWAAKYLKKESPSGAGLPPPLFVPPPVAGRGGEMGAAVSGFVDSKELNKYRSAQKLKARGLHPDFLQNAAIVMDVANQAGADPALMIATMIQESAGNAGARGDRSRKSPEGASLGLFQLNKHGAGKGMTEAEKFNPYINAQTQAGKFAAVAAKHPEWSKGHVASAVQRPGEFIAAREQGRNIESIGYTRSVNSMIPFAEKIITRILKERDEGIANHMAEQNSHLSKLVNETMKGNDHREKAHKENKMNLALNKGNPAAQLQQQVINQSIL